MSHPTTHSHSQHSRHWLHSQNWALASLAILSLILSLAFYSLLSNIINWVGLALEKEMQALHENIVETVSHR